MQANFAGGGWPLRATVVARAWPVFITGANGFIGRTLAERWRELGAEVAGVDIAEDPERGVVAGDVSQPGRLAAGGARE